MSKLHNTSASIAFIKKALFVDMISKFAVVKGWFIHEMDSSIASHKLMKSHLTKHVQELYGLWTQHNDLKSLLYSNVCIALRNILTSIVQRLFSKCFYLSFKTKNKKIVNLIKQKEKTM